MDQKKAGGSSAGGKHEGQRVLNDIGRTIDFEREKQKPNPLICHNRAPFAYLMCETGKQNAKPQLQINAIYLE
jgi:hypothetical protein